MRFPRYPSVLAIPAAVALGLGLFAASLTWQVPAAQAGSGALDAQSREMVRLINGARAVEGRPALAVDPFLASKARDGAIPCPDDAAKSIAGRALDFASYGTMSHYLRLCDAPSYTLSGTTFVSVLQNAWAYWTVGEIDLVNGGYGNGAFLYTLGSWQTWTYSTTGNAMLGWKSSSSHWNIIVGSYDRVGCGGWASGSTYYYDCLFSAGGSSPSGLQSPPTESPFSNPLPPAAPVATPAAPVVPVAPAPHVTARPVVPPPAAGGAGGGAAATPAPSASVVSATPGAPTPSSVPTGASAVLGVKVPAPSPTPARLAAALIVDNGPGVSSDAATLPPPVARTAALVAGGGALALYAAYALLANRRRRRRGGREPAS